MIPQKCRTIPFVCPGCLAVFEISFREAGENVPKCNYCGIPLERIKTGGEE